MSVMLDCRASVPEWRLSRSTRSTRLDDEAGELGSSRERLHQCLLVWRLSLGSPVAWGLGLFMAVGSAVSVALIGVTTIGVSESLFTVICLAQAVVLLTPTVCRLIRSHHKAPPAAA
jgi:hypothetical protein